MLPYLSGVKLHKKDDFLLSYSLDGCSVSFDYPVLKKNTENQNKLFLILHELVADNNGLIYLAKDNLLTPKHFRKMYGDRINRFLDIKKKYDPIGLSQSNMFRRLFLKN